MKLNTPMLLRIKITIPAKPHTKNVIADDKLSLYFSVVVSYKFPFVLMILSSSLSSSSFSEKM